MPPRKPFEGGRYGAGFVAHLIVMKCTDSSLMMQRPHQRGFMGTFLSDVLIAYRFAPDRSRETPPAVLGGTLVVDA